ncbi:hypothetical protein C7S18_23825 (plasmid) [Ahniella affigens]|uniref:Uncharacterized protein n=1 Tax=Ahniella affigens TaxID=2021234 RepID=A0A2P1PZQ9_9GAMM|nr:hypothetical protein C7S18_23825 [Ahniella affigens]
MLTRLNHITLTTGHARWSPRSEVSESFLRELVPMIRECEKHGVVDLPTPSGLMQLSRLEGPGPADQTACWAIRPPGGPALVTIALAISRDAGVDMWAMLHMIEEPGNPRSTRAGEPAEAPWLAVIPHVALALYPDASAWLGDAERCIAWAWIQMQSELGSGCG